MPDRRRVGPTADRVLEEDVRSEGDGVVGDESEVVVGMPRRLERLDAETASLHRPLDDLEPVALDQFGVAGDMIGMRVRRQQVRNVETFALDDLVQRIERRAAVDEDGRSAGLVRE